MKNHAQRAISSSDQPNEFHFLGRENKKNYLAPEFHFNFKTCKFFEVDPVLALPDLILNHFCKDFKL
jgi:hypothetical protein